MGMTRLTCHRLLAAVIFLVTVVRLQANQPDPINEKLRTCPDGLVNDLRNATVVCTQANTATDVAEDPSELTSGSAETAEAALGSRGVGVLQENGRDLISMAKRRRRRNSGGHRDNEGGSLVLQAPATDVLDHELNSEEIHSPIVLCAVERLRILHPLLDAILEHCNSSVVLAGVAALESNATAGRSAGGVAALNASVEFPLHAHPRHLHVHERILHLMHLATCLDEKLRTACPTLDIAAHIHSL